MQLLQARQLVSQPVCCVLGRVVAPNLPLAPAAPAQAPRFGEGRSD